MGLLCELITMESMGSWWDNNLVRGKRGGIHEKIIL